MADQGRRGPGQDAEGAEPGESGSGETQDDPLGRLRSEEHPETLLEGADVRGGVGPVHAEDLPLFFRILDRSINALLVVGFALLLMVIGWNVFARMLFGGGIPWADEASRFLFIWVAFLGASVAYFRREHISVGFLVDKLPPPLRLTVMVLQELLVLGVLAYLMYGAYVLMQVSIRSSPLLGIALTWWFAAVPVSSVLMAMMAIYRIFGLVRDRG
jgi:TRAP-type transport system small permease protein